jgi:mycoredoxin
MAEQIILYGTSWCWSSSRVKKLLDKNEIVYQWIDIDDDEDAARVVMQITKGYRSVPTLLFPDGTSLVEPSDNELKTKLGISD